MYKCCILINDDVKEIQDMMAAGTTERSRRGNHVETEDTFTS